MAMAWVLQDCDQILKLGETRKDFGCVMKEKLQAEEQLREKVEEQLETQRAELEGAHAELKTIQAELAKLKETSSKYREDTLMEISRLQAQADDTERKLAGVPRKLLQLRLRPWSSASLWLSSNRSRRRALTMVPTHLYTTFGVSIQNETCLSSGRRPRR